MPCKDTTSKVTIFLNKDDCLIDFDFSKITCNKEIGGGTGYLEYCKGKSAEEILRLEFDESLDILKPKSTEDQFLLYMEWDALRTSIAQFLGSDFDIDHKRYQITSINSDEAGTTVTQVMRPPDKMPKIVSCKKRANSIEID